MQKHNTRLQSWFVMFAWVLVGIKLFWQLTRSFPVGSGLDVVVQIPPAHLAALPMLLGVWVGGFVTIVGLAAAKSHYDHKDQTLVKGQPPVAP